jgi:hypothetical protein
MENLSHELILIADQISRAIREIRGAADTLEAAGNRLLAKAVELDTERERNGRD